MYLHSSRRAKQSKESLLRIRIGAASSEAAIVQGRRRSGESQNQMSVGVRECCLNNCDLYIRLRKLIELFRMNVICESH